MLKVLAQSWPLLLGIMLLMVGNGVQGSLLGIRGALEGFSTFQLSVVMSAYFLGFLSGSRLAPGMIRRVGHVRVFSALGSLISAVLVLYPMALDWTVPRWLAAEESWLTLALQPWVLWSLMRVLIGFCFSGIYVTAESWLNNTATNETRGQALSAYMIVQMLGIIASQGLLALGDPTGYGLFIIPSVLVSLAFMPLLLADVPAPTFASIKPMKFRTLFRISPLGCAGMLLTGGVFSAMFGMASVYGAKSAMTISQIAAFVAAMYVGGLLLQYPVGWLSDRFDRRLLILWMSAIGAAVMAVATMIALPFQFELIVALLLGGGDHQPDLFAADGPYQRLSRQRGNGGGQRRADVHQRLRRDHRAADHRLGDGAGGRQGLFPGDRRVLCRACRLCRLADDAARGTGGPFGLCRPYTHRLVAGGRSGAGRGSAALTVARGR